MDSVFTGDEITAITNVINGADAGSPAFCNNGGLFAIRQFFSRDAINNAVCFYR